MTGKYLPYLLLLCFVFARPSASLVPIENLVLGDFEEGDLKVDSGPLDYLFSELDDNSTAKSQQAQLKKILGIFLEGKNLDNFCTKRIPIRYSSDWERRLALRSMLTTLQFMSLDVAVRSIGMLSKKLGFSEGEYENLTNRLMQNYCSENTTVISLRELRNNLFKEFRVPSMQQMDLRYFPIEILEDIMQPKDKQDEQELLMAVHLFKSACSWGGRTTNIRLLLPLAKDPVIMSYVIRKMSDTAIDWDKENNTPILIEKTGVHKALCLNTICRLRPSDEFAESFPFSVGGTSIKDDLERLYCQELSKLEYNEEELPKTVKTWVKEASEERDNLLRSFLLSGITGVPALDVQAKNFKNLRTILRASIDRSWTEWAVLANENHIKDLFYEEPLVVEVIPRIRYFDIFSPNLRVELGVNLGELDRSNIGHGKIAANFELKLSKQFLRWIRRIWILRNTNSDKDIKEIEQRFMTQIAPQIETLKKRFKQPFWQDNRDLESLITFELLTQLERYRGQFYNDPPKSDEFVTIPLKFYFGPYALKYLSHRARIRIYEKNQQKTEDKK